MLRCVGWGAPAICGATGVPVWSHKWTPTDAQMWYGIFSTCTPLQNTEVPTSALRGHIPTLGFPRDPTHLAGIKLQGLGTLFATQPEKSSIL